MENVITFKVENEKFIIKKNKIYRTYAGDEEPNVIALFAPIRIKRYTDILHLDSCPVPLYDFTYYDGYLNREVNIEKETLNFIHKTLMINGLFTTDKNKSKKILTAIIQAYQREGLLENEETLIYDGFFINHQGKLVSKTPIDHLTHDDEKIKEALSLLVELIEFKEENATMMANILRRMLRAPYNFCLKQLGYEDPNANGLELSGKAKTGKTTVALIGMWFYDIAPREVNISLDTNASMSRYMAKTTFPTILDEAYKLMSSPATQNTLKTGMYNKYSRSIADTTDADATKEYLALSTPILSYNEAVNITDDGLRRRLDKLIFDFSNEIQPEEMSRFRSKFLPMSKHSPLSKLKWIGVAFKEYIKPFLEAEDFELQDMEGLVNEFFVDLFLKYDLPICEPLISRMETAEELCSDDYATTMVSHFNKEFFRNMFVIDACRSNYLGLDTLVRIVKNGQISWINGYQPTNQVYIVDTREFTKICNNVCNHTFTVKELFSILEIEEKEIKSMKVNGKTYRKCAKLSPGEVWHKILGVNELGDYEF